MTCKPYVHAIDFIKAVRVAAKKEERQRLDQEELRRYCVLIKIPKDDFCFCSLIMVVNALS